MNDLMYLIIFCTCPDKSSAELIARQLVEKELAACINILPSITSVYRWKDEIETAEEHLLLIKSRQNIYPELEQQLRSLHPYEVPEIITTSIENGLPDYLKWIDSCLKPL
jgi:periplasmic divalent cation tolerance protein